MIEIVWLILEILKKISKRHRLTHKQNYKALIGTVCSYSFFMFDLILKIPVTILQL